MFGWFRRSREKPSRLPVDRLRGEIWVVQGHCLGQKRSLDEGEIRIGRAVEGERDIILPEEAKLISGEHARFVKESDGYSIEDLGSRNGTYVNGRGVKRARLEDGDEIDIGQVIISVRIRPADGEGDTLDGFLDAEGGTLDGRSWSLDAGEILVGRGLDEEEGVAGLPEEDRSVSTEHAVFKKERGAYWVQDLGSKNGTFVNGKGVLTARLKDGDRVGIGDAIFRVRIQSKR